MSTGGGATQMLNQAAATNAGMPSASNPVMMSNRGGNFSVDTQTGQPTRLPINNTGFNPQTAFPSLLSPYSTPAASTRGIVGTALQSGNPPWANQGFNTNPQLPAWLRPAGFPGQGTPQGSPFQTGYQSPAARYQQPANADIQASPGFQWQQNFMEQMRAQQAAQVAAAQQRQQQLAATRQAQTIGAGTPGAGTPGAGAPKYDGTLYYPPVDEFSSGRLSDPYTYMYAKGGIVSLLGRKRKR